MSTVSTWRRITDVGSDAKQDEIRKRLLALGRAHGALVLPSGSTTIDHIVRANGGELSARNRRDIAAILFEVFGGHVFIVGDAAADHIIAGGRADYAYLQFHHDPARGKHIVRLAFGGALPKHSSPNRTRVRSPWRVLPTTTRMVREMARARRLSPSAVVEYAIADYYRRDLK